MDKQNQVDAQHHSSQTPSSQPANPPEDKKLSPSLPEGWQRPQENSLKDSVYLSEFVEQRSRLLIRIRLNRLSSHSHSLALYSSFMGISNDWRVGRAFTGTLARADTCVLPPPKLHKKMGKEFVGVLILGFAVNWGIVSINDSLSSC